MMPAMRKLLWLAVLLSGIGCKSKDKTPASTTGGTTAPPPVAMATQPVGMSDPFARLTSEAGKSLNKGYKALKAKKYDEAAAAFREVTAAVPDYTQARMALLRTLILGGQMADVPKEYEALIARDYVGFAGALDAKKEFAPLRAAPEWQKIGELKEAYRAAYAKGLDGGFFFVARTHAASEPQFVGGATDTGLDLKQEVFHFDPAQKKFRRLTETGGHAFAVARAGDGKTLAFLAAPKLHRENGVDSLVDPQLGTVDLGSLEVTGPTATHGRFESVTLGFEKSGGPVFELFDPETHQAKWLRFDTAKTGLAAVTDAEREGGFTTATAARVTHVSGKEIEGVTIEDGANQFKIAAAAAPVVAARPLAAESLDWSPSKNRITYAGKIDACKILKGQSKEKNELYVFDVAKKSAQRVAAAISGFETLWLDDDHLVYEGGVGKDGQLHVYSFAEHADGALPTRYGAGLYGVPTLACEAAEPSPEPTTDDGNDADGD
jgi:hypothetical protein